MTSFIEVFQNNPMAVIFGAMGLACQLVWPVFSQRSRILSVQFGIGANYGIQYALLDAWSGAGVCGLGATQTAVALFAGERTWLRKMGLFFLPVVAFVCYATWSGYSSLFALCACSLVMLGRLQQDTLRLRLFLLAAAPFGIGYDISVGAMPALFGAVTSATIALVMLIRELRDRGLLPRSYLRTPA